MPLSIKQRDLAFSFPLSSMSDTPNLSKRPRASRHYLLTVYFDEALEGCTNRDAETMEELDVSELLCPDTRRPFYQVSVKTSTMLKSLRLRRILATPSISR